MSVSLENCGEGEERRTPPSKKPPDCPSAEIRVSGPIHQHTRQPGKRKPFVSPPIKIILSSLTSSTNSAAET